MSSMRVERKTDAKNGVARLIFYVVALVLQVSFLYFTWRWIKEVSTTVRILTEITAFIVVLVIYGRHMTSSRKMPWLVLISFLPILGIICWFFIESESATGPMRKRFESIDRRLDLFRVQEDGVQEEMKEQYPLSTGVSAYLWNTRHYPLCRAEEMTFFGDTCEALAAQIEDLKKAEHFIFMEYYAIENKQAFAPVREVLRQKAAEGVEVRLFFDDIGSVCFIDSGSFATMMQEDGVETRVFNRFMPSLRIFMNNRDHHKIMVVDGKVAYTGGYNLADEYFNITRPYNEWSDCGIRVTGPAVHTFTTIFLEMWNAIRESDRDDTQFGRYFPGLRIPETLPEGYGDDPDLTKWWEEELSNSAEGKITLPPATPMALREAQAAGQEAAGAAGQGAFDPAGCTAPSAEAGTSAAERSEEDVSESQAAAQSITSQKAAAQSGTKDISAENAAAQTAAQNISAENAAVQGGDTPAREFLQPYADSPLDELPVGEDVYLAIVNSAQDYVWFVSPYLVLTDEMSRAFTLAAERGVDVRIVTPGIPDKKTTYQLTRSNYAQLVRKGVRIFEFRPGFCHDKICASDDRISTCGTINLDYRSLYHHFEDGCVMYSPRMCAEVKGKIDWLMSRSEEVTERYRDVNRNLPFRIYQCIIRFFAPLM